MKWFFVACFILFNAQAMAESTAAGTQGKIVGGIAFDYPSWFKESFLDIAEDAAEAGAAGRHVMLFMTLNGCPYCAKMLDENLENAPYRDFIQANFDVIGLNIRGDREVAFDADTQLTEKELASQLKVVYTPTVVFLNAENQVVARINGYRSVDDFKRVLDYVQGQQYRQSSLADYLDGLKQARYAFRQHAQLHSHSDLSALGDKPLAVLFEDRDCGDCDALHDGHLADAEVNQLLQNFHFVRLDALSEGQLTDPQGNSTSPRQYAADLGLTYRPGLVLFDQGKEIMRVQSMLYPYHFREILRYVGERKYRDYPDSFYDYLDVRTAELLEQGVNVNVGQD